MAQVRALPWISTNQPLHNLNFALICFMYARKHAPPHQHKHGCAPPNFGLSRGLANLLDPPAEAQNSPNLTATLPSNNPFRNRAASPASYHSLPSPQIATFNLPGHAVEKPASRNPFLDQIPQTMPATRGRMSPTKPAFSGNTAELFVCHSLVLLIPAVSSTTGRHWLNPSSTGQSDSQREIWKRWTSTTNGSTSRTSTAKTRKRTARRAASVRATASPSKIRR